MITAIILCGDDAVGIVNSEMSAEHYRQLTEIRKLARSVATQAPLMRQHFEIMYHTFRWPRPASDRCEARNLG